jgi:hypothetical protein
MLRSESCPICCPTYRTGRDAAEAGRREIGKYRFTSLNRALLRDAEKGAPQAGSAHSIVVKDLVS